MTFRKEVVGDCTLYLGDCRDVLPTLGKVDAVVTDPPYGLDGSKTNKNDYISFIDNEGDVLRLVNFVLSWFDGTRVIITPGQKMMFRYKEPSAVGAFYFPSGTGSCSWGFVGWQPIFYYGKDPFLADGMGRRSNCFLSNEPAEKNGHPCPKPLGVWSKLLTRATRMNETILDPFMGSGTTGVACVNLGRKFVGIEIDECYFDIACRRIEKAYAQPRLFAEPVPKLKQVAML